MKLDCASPTSSYPRLFSVFYSFVCIRSSESFTEARNAALVNPWRPGIERGLSTELPTTTYTHLPPFSDSDLSHYPPYFGGSPKGVIAHKPVTAGMSASFCFSFLFFILLITIIITN